MKCHCCSREYSITNKPYGLSHFICKNCGHRYRTAENAAEYHASEYTSRLNTREPEQRVHNALIKMVQPYLIQCKTFLDVGPGLGLFEQRASKYVDIEAIEVNPTFADKCRKLGFTVHCSDFMTFEPKNKYDGVSIWNTLEHFDNIGEVVEKMKALSHRFIMIEIPTEDNGITYYISRFFKPAFRGHFHNFTTASFKAFLKSHDLKVVLLRKGSRQSCLMAVCEI